MRVSKNRSFLLFFLSAFFCMSFFSFFQTTQADAHSEPDDVAKLFFSNLVKVSENAESRRAVQESAELNPGLLTTFLNDMVEATAAFEKQNFTEPSLDPAQDFVNRWSHIASDDSSSAVTQIVFERILEKFLDSLTYDKNQGGPLSGLFRFFQTMSQKNLNGFEALFQFSWPEPQKRRLWVYERKLVTGKGREEDTFVQTRYVVKTVDNFAEFVEFIADNKLAYLMTTFQEVTLLNQVLEEMDRDGASPEALQFIQSYIDLINQELALAWVNGDLDPFLKQFFSNPDFQAKNLVFLKHPLLKPPYRPDEFKVLPYYIK